MDDPLTPEQRSNLMSRVRSKDTTSELILRKALWSIGLRYRLQYDVAGTPDVAFPGAKVAVFVDGCFWHGCPKHFRIPGTNSEFWQEKIAANKTRDANVDAALQKDGWTVLRFWSHQVKSADLPTIVAEIRAVVERG